MLGDRDRRDFLEGSHRLKEEMAARLQDGAKVRAEKHANDCHYLSLCALIHLTCSQTDGIAEWTVNECLHAHSCSTERPAVAWNMATIVVVVHFDNRSMVQVF